MADEVKNEKPDEGGGTTTDVLTLVEFHAWACDFIQSCVVNHGQAGLAEGMKLIILAMINNKEFGCAKNAEPPKPKSSIILLNQ